MTQTNKQNEIRACIHPGAMVDIVLKKDQPTGRLTRGTVKAILTNSRTHPRGIKVMLTDGSVGRVQAILGDTNNLTPPNAPKREKAVDGTIPTNGWRNKPGEARFAVSKTEWIKRASTDWPLFCSVGDCCGIATTVCVIENAHTTGEYALPQCLICSGLSREFSIQHKTNLLHINAEYNAAQE